jgi:ribosome-associated heat shock protein Hsp15
MTEATARVRLDKWLWAARFFKTRALAGVAVNGGKVHLDGHRIKPSRSVKIDDCFEDEAEKRKLAALARPRSEGRPDKKQRRQIHRFTGKT